MAATRDATQIDAIAVTAGPGLAGALLVGASIGHALGYALAAPGLSSSSHGRSSALAVVVAAGTRFPFVALLVSGGHTQLLHVRGWGDYELLGETLDDAAGEAFDKTAQLLGLGYPGGPAVSRLAEFGDPGAITLPRPMLGSGDLNFSFSGLKTAVLTAVRRAGPGNVCEQARADIARAFVESIVDVLATKALRALDQSGLKTLVVAGGVGANAQLRERLQWKYRSAEVRCFFRRSDLCTDNGAMIALAGLAKLKRAVRSADRCSTAAFSVHPRWSLAEATSPSGAPLPPAHSRCCANAALGTREQVTDVYLVAIHRESGNDDQRDKTRVESPSERGIKRRENGGGDRRQR